MNPHHNESTDISGFISGGFSPESQNKKIWYAFYALIALLLLFIFGRSIAKVTNDDDAEPYDLMELPDFSCRKKTLDA